MYELQGCQWSGEKIYVTLKDNRIEYCRNSDIINNHLARMRYLALLELS